MGRVVSITVISALSLLAFFSAFAGDLFVDKNDIRRSISSNEKMIARFESKLKTISHSPAVQADETKKLRDKIMFLEEENEKLSLTLFGIKPELGAKPLRQISVEEKSK